MEKRVVVIDYKKPIAWRCYDPYIARRNGFDRFRVERNREPINSTLERGLARQVPSFIKSNTNIVLDLKRIFSYHSRKLSVCGRVGIN